MLSLPWKYARERHFFGHFKKKELFYYFLYNIAIKMQKKRSRLVIHTNLKKPLESRDQKPGRGDFFSCISHEDLLKYGQCIVKKVTILAIGKEGSSQEKGARRARHLCFPHSVYETDHCRANGGRHRTAAGNRPSGGCGLLAAARQEPDAPL